MGCDIHLHIEIRVAGKWHHYSAPSIARNYELFNILAGVRHNPDDPDPIIPPRGLPEDMTEVTRMDMDGFGKYGHHASWFGLPEICKLTDWLTEQGGFKMGMDLEHHILHCYLFRNSFAGVLKYPQDDHHGVEDVRFIFCFDN